MSRLNYLLLLLGWALPFIVGQWFIAPGAIRRYGWVIFRTAIGVTLFYFVVDSVAVAEGIWFFDPAQNLGVKIGILPMEEVLFFFLTSVLVAQSFIILLPESER